MLPIVTLKRGKSEFIRRRHPWIFSGALFRPDKSLSNGSLVWLEDEHGKVVATGHYFKGSIAVRILAFEMLESLDTDFWKKKLQQAWNIRTLSGLTTDEQTNAFRWIHAEGDGLPGLIIDYYHGNAVIETHSEGMAQSLEQIVDAMNQLDFVELDSIYHKSKVKNDSGQSGWLKGKKTGCTISEHGILYKVNWETGQKTGFFLDQRPNRLLLRKYSKERRVLNTFGYTGGFALSALTGDAQRAVNLDISQPANDLATENFKLNGHEGNYECVSADCFDFLQEQAQHYDLIILDPPAFAKNIRSRHNAVIGYKRLNAIAISKIPKNGIIFTFSCSQVVDRQLFRDTVVAAGIESGRQVQILHEMSQGPDHPVNLYHPEGSYLKGLVLRVD